MQRRVVVTGIGLVTPLGSGPGHQVFQQLIAGRNGIRELPSEVIPNGCGVKVAGLVPRGKDIGQFDESEFKSMDREISLFIKYALKATEYALQDSKLSTVVTSPDVFPYQRERCGVSIGNGGIGSLLEICSTHDTLKTSIRKVSPYFVPKILVNMASGHVSIKHGFAGPVHSVTTACAAGSHSIGDAYNFIRLGYADVMLAGGSDASIEPLALAGFSRMKALSVPIEGKDSTTTSRPFDSQRNGFVMGEGAGILVLEELSSAIARNAPIIGEICGYGLSGDAHHATTPPENGDGAYRSMRTALRDASLSPTDIGYVNCHATSTPLGDQAEIIAIRRLFTDPNHNSSDSSINNTNDNNSKHTVYVSSTKGATGHLLGAAGAVESAFTLLALQQNILPPTLHLENIDPSLLANCRTINSNEVEIAHLPQTAMTDRIINSSIKYALKNSFGFGGTNASLVFGKYFPSK